MRDELGRFLRGHKTKLDEETRRKISNAKLGRNNPQWKGGRLYLPSGYVICYKPDHPCAFTRNTYVREHRLVMEQKLGRLLKRNEVVHHINGIKDDNRPENLTIMKKGEHHSLHNKGVSQRRKYGKRKRRNNTNRNRK